MKGIYSILVLNLFLFSCKERLTLQKADVTKYVWLRPFILDNVSDFKGEHYMDRGDLKFDCSYQEPNEKFLSAMDSVANAEK